jgi:superfamily II DNA or RNA helicase
MAFPVLVSSLTESEKKQIYTDLLVTPDHHHQKFQKYLQSSASLLPSSKPFHFFVIKKQADNGKNDEIMLPLFFAKKLFAQKTPVPGICDAWKSLPFEMVQHANASVHLRPEQTFIIAEAMSQLETHGTTTIQAQPGAGKTIMASLLAARLGLSYAVLYPMSTLEKQWLATSEMVFGKHATVHVADQPAVAQKKEGAASNDASIMYSLCDRASSLPLERRARIGTLIIDEAHMYCVSSMVNTILAFEPKYVIVLTATLERTDTAHSVMHLLAGEHNVFRAPSRPYLLVQYKVPIRVEEKQNRVTKTLDFTSLCTALSENADYNNAIIRTVVQNPDRKFIIISKLVSHAQSICRQLGGCGVSTDYMCGSSKKKYKDCRALCGTFSKISTGFDAATFASNFDGRSPDTLILCHTIKAWQLYAQTVGRIMRACQDVVPVVVWMCAENSITTRHLSGLHGYINRTGGVIYKLQSNDDSNNNYLTSIAAEKVDATTKK